MRRSHAVAVLAAVGLTLATAQVAVGDVGTDPSSCVGFNGQVDALVINNGVTYVGGNFTSAIDTNGQSHQRVHLAAVDTATCALLPWAPSTDGNVDAIAVSGSTVYVGGSFTTINGQGRKNLGAVSASDGSVTSFNPGPTNTVAALVASSSELYVGGFFTSVAAGSATHLAAFSLADGSFDRSWSPNAAGRVYALALSPDQTTVYVGGNFTRLDGQTSLAYLGAVDAVTGAVDSTFAPSVSDIPVRSIVADSTSVYVGAAGSGGHFSVRNLDGTLRWPIQQTDGDVATVAVSDGVMYVGGHFQNYCIGGTGSGAPFICTNPLPRNKALAFSLTGTSAGTVTSWNPDFNSAKGVVASAVDPATGNLWLGGNFTRAGTTPADRLAVLPAPTGSGGGGATVPGAPTGLAATAGTSSVSLTWSAPVSDGGSAITGYQIYRSGSSGTEVPLATTSGTGTSYTDSAVTAGGTYYYKVAAINGVGTGPQSGEAYATVPSGGGLTAPNPPTNLTATAGSSSVSLTWSAPTTGSAPSGYYIYRSTTSGQEALYANTQATSYSDSAVTAGDTYYYQVSAFNSAGESARTSEAYATVPTSGGGTGGTLCGGELGQAPDIQHVVMVTFENKMRSQVIGSSYAPYLNSLANQCGQATNMYALTPTSLANYIALTSGYDGYPNVITSNRSPSVWPQPQTSLFEQFAPGESREYAESMPSNCYTGSAVTEFTVNHTPFPYYTDAATSSLCKTYDVPMPSDPTNMDFSAKFTLLTPNKKDIMHMDGTSSTQTRDQQVANGDAWAKATFPAIFASPQYQAGNTVVIVVWDEGSGTNENIPYIVISPYTAPGCQVTVAGETFNHYSTIKGIEQNFHLPLLGNAGNSNLASVFDYFGLGAASASTGC